VRAGDDEQDLAGTEAVDALIGAPDVRDNGQAVGVGIEQDRIVGGDQRVIGAVADQGRPRVGLDQLAHGPLVGLGVGWVVSHDGR
jgi:hypothetical protein